MCPFGRDGKSNHYSTKFLCLVFLVASFRILKMVSLREFLIPQKRSRMPWKVKPPKKAKREVKEVALCMCVPHLTCCVHHAKRARLQLGCRHGSCCPGIPPHLCGLCCRPRGLGLRCGGIKHAGAWCAKECVSSLKVRVRVKIRVRIRVRA